MSNGGSDEDGDQYALSASRWDRGVRLLWLADNSHTWVKRRVEHIEFDDDRTIRRATTLDVSIGKADLERLPAWRGRLLLPVKMLTRDLDSDATVTMADGTPLPQLTRRHERSLVAAGIVAEYQGDEMDPAVVYARALATIDPELYEGPPFEILTDTATDFDDLLATYAKFRLLIAALSTQDDGTHGLSVRLQVSHAESLPSVDHSEDLVEVDRSSPRHRDDRLIVFPVDQADSCESFHFELVAPPGLIVKEGSLQVTRLDMEQINSVEHLLQSSDPVRAPADVGRLVEALESSSNTTCYKDDDLHVNRMHVYSPRPEPLAPLLDAKVLVILRPMTAGTMRPGFLTSIFTTLCVIGLWWTVGWAGAPDWSPHLSSVAYDVSQESVVATLLLGPTLLAGVMANQDEHQLTKRLLFRHRCRLALQASAAFLAAATYAVGVPPEVRWWILGGGAVVSLVLTMMEYLSYQASRASLDALTSSAKVEHDPVEGHRIRG